jgi:hypothetical protein
VNGGECDQRNIQWDCGTAGTAWELLGRVDDGCPSSEFGSSGPYDTKCRSNGMKDVGTGLPHAPHTHLFFLLEWSFGVRNRTRNMHCGKGEMCIPKLVLGEALFVE